MSMPSFTDLPAWAMALSLAVHLAVGVAIGVVHFRSVWSTAQRFSSGGGATTVIVSTMLRLAVVGGLLTVASLQGALPLLVMACGILIGRSAVMRTVGEAAR